MLNTVYEPATQVRGFTSWQRRLGGALGAAVLSLGLLACGGGGGDTTAAREQPKALDDPNAALSGAIYTSTGPVCSTVNENHYPTKPDVYLNGGPQGGGSGLPSGTYYVQVTDPSGAKLLGYTTTASVQVNSSGNFVSCYQLWAILVRPDGVTQGYDDTTNNGGVYKVWVSPEIVGGDPKAPFANDRSKTDNFKVANGDNPPCNPNTDPNCVENTLGELKVFKYYDANASGTYEVGEAILTNWKVNITPLDGQAAIGDKFTTYNEFVSIGNYSVYEYMPIQANWLATDGGTKPALVNTGTPAVVSFGNVCLGAGGGLTLGFWSNKNGQALVSAADLAELVALNLKSGNGADFNPGNYAALRAWLLNGTAVNMAYMLSVQLAAMKLNVYNGFVGAGSLVYAPGVTSATLLGFVSISALMAEANAELALHPNTTSINSFRNYQEALKNALDKANNNLNFVQATACAYTFN